MSCSRVLEHVAKDSDDESPPTKKLRSGKDKDDRNTEEPNPDGIGFAVYAWGHTDGDSHENEMIPVFVEALSAELIQQVSISKDSETSYTLTTHGQLRQWGQQGKDWSSVGHKVRGLEPKSVVDEKFRRISSGPDFHAAINTKGQLFTWGNGGGGVLGHLDEAGKDLPTLVSSLQSIPIQQVSCGYYHTLALTAPGALYSWGDNDHTGHGHLSGHQLEPKQIEKLQNVRISKMAVRHMHSAAVSENGKLYTWGFQNKCVLGHNNESSQEPNEVHLPNTISSVGDIDCGCDHTALVTCGGLVYTWGENNEGQLGLGHGDPVEGLTLVSALQGTQVCRVYCGHYCTYALTAEGKVLSWGDGGCGRLGHGSDKHVFSPREVKGLQTVRDLSLSDRGAVALVEYSSMPKDDKLSLGRVCMMMLNDDEFSDITFLVENKPIRAHRCFLAQRSDVFRTMFLTGMKESNEETVTINDVQYAVFHKFIMYLYTNQIVVKDDHVMDLYQLADMHHMSKLKDLCYKSLEKQVSVENAARFLCEASGYEDLKKICIEFIQINFAKVTKTDGMNLLYARGDLLKEVVEGKDLVPGK